MLKLTKEQEEQVRMQLERDSAYQSLKRQEQRLREQYMYVQALQVRKKMKQFYDAVVKALEEEAVEERVTLNEIVKQLGSEEEVLYFRTRLVTALFCVDMLDTCVFDLDHRMRHLDGTLHLDTFDKLLKMGKEVKAAMSLITTQSEEHARLRADYMDSIEDYVFRRAAAFLKKQDALCAKLQKARQTTSKPENHG